MLATMQARILKPSTYRLQIFLVRDQYLQSLLPYGDQTIAGQLEKHVLKPIGGFPVMAENTRNHTFSKEISQVIIAAMVLAPNFY